MRSLLAILCPPLAVLAFGTRSQAAKNAGLFLLFYIPGLIHALQVVEKHNVERQYESIFQAMDRIAA
ncbi:MAG TPA: YqaE/Pmp3 family membrane protein [Gemmataceae bacterium]